MIAINRICIPKSRFFISLAFILFCFWVISAYATEEHSDKTQQDCQTCHIDSEGGDLNQKGDDYKASGYRWPPEKSKTALVPIPKAARLFIGYFHILAAFLWFGTILYVHLLLKPAYASKGLPKGEVVLGAVSMVVMGITGIMLTLSRIRSFSVLYQTTWGVTLLIKVLLYCIMITSAMVVVTWIGPRLKKGKKRGILPKGDVFDTLTLSGFDGNEGRPGFIAFKAKVYDVSGLKLWSGGTHLKKHLAGTDLSAAIAQAPHGEEKLENLKVAGQYNATLKLPLTFAQQAFYFIAYMNLILVFAVLFVIAYWRWPI